MRVVKSLLSRQRYLGALIENLEVSDVAVTACVTADNVHNLILNFYVRVEVEVVEYVLNKRHHTRGTGHRKSCVTRLDLLRCRGAVECGGAYCKLNRIDRNGNGRAYAVEYGFESHTAYSVIAEHQRQSRVLNVGQVEAELYVKQSEYSVEQTGIEGELELIVLDIDIERDRSRLATRRSVGSAVGIGFAVRVGACVCNGISLVAVVAVRAAEYARHALELDFAESEACSVDVNGVGHNIAVRAYLIAAGGLIVLESGRAEIVNAYQLLVERIAHRHVYGNIAVKYTCNTVKNYGAEVDIGFEVDYKVDTFVCAAEGKGCKRRLEVMRSIAPISLLDVSLVCAVVLVHLALIELSVRKRHISGSAELLIIAERVNAAEQRTEQLVAKPRRKAVVIARVASCETSGGNLNGYSHMSADRRQSERVDKVYLRSVDNSLKVDRAERYVFALVADNARNNSLAVLHVLGDCGHIEVERQIQRVAEAHIKANLGMVGSRVGADMQQPVAEVGQQIFNLLAADLHNLLIHCVDKVRVELQQYLVRTEQEHNVLPIHHIALDDVNLILGGSACLVVCETAVVNRADKLTERVFNQRIYVYALELYLGSFAEETAEVNVNAVVKQVYAEQS